MATRHLIAASVIALSLAPPAIADSELGVVPAPTVVREWFRSETTLVNESVNRGHHQCVLHLINGAATLGIQSTEGAGIFVFLQDRRFDGPFTKGYLRIQVDNQTPWRINGDVDPATSNMFLSTPLSDRGASGLVPQIIYGNVVRAETKDTIYTWSLAGSAAAMQATVACERAIKGVRQVAPATRDLTL